MVDSIVSKFKSKIYFLNIRIFPDANVQLSAENSFAIFFQLFKSRSPLIKTRTNISLI